MQGLNLLCHKWMPTIVGAINLAPTTSTSKEYHQIVMLNWSAYSKRGLVLLKKQFYLHRDRLRKKTMTRTTTFCQVVIFRGHWDYLPKPHRTWQQLGWSWVWEDTLHAQIFVIKQQKRPLNR